VLAARPDVNCAVHVHTGGRHALAGLQHGLRMVSQQAIRFYRRIGYHAYEGITEDFDERARINQDLGGNRAMIMHNHGLAYGRQDRARGLCADEGAACRRRDSAQAGSDGSELLEVPPEVCAKTAEQYEHHDAGRGSADWAAYLRMLDGVDTS